MVTASGRNNLLTTAHESALARETLVSLEGADSFLALGRTDEDTNPLPKELGLLLQEVLRAVASGSAVTVMTTPQVVTTSTAAGILGISRPTLMKMINDGSLPAHKVGTHTRLKADDVFAAKKARRARERAAFQTLLETEGDE